MIHFYSLEGFCPIIYRSHFYSLEGFCRFPIYRNFLPRTAVNFGHDLEINLAFHLVILIVLYCIVLYCVVLCCVVLCCVELSCVVLCCVVLCCVVLCCVVLYCIRLAVWRCVMMVSPRTRS